MKKTWIICGTLSILALSVLVGCIEVEPTNPSTEQVSEQSSEWGSSEQGSSEQESERITILDAKVKEADVKNGSGTAVIGKRAYIKITKAELTALSQEQFQQFVNEVVKDSGYNYVSIIAGDTGIVFPSSMTAMAQYGDVNPDGTLKSTHGYIKLQQDGTYKYESK